MTKTNITPEGITATVAHVFPYKETEIVHWDLDNIVVKVDGREWVIRLWNINETECSWSLFDETIQDVVREGVFMYKKY